uniref:Transcription factor grauzone n=1 Tax=Glossina brevipalpis TaxID=37001 RepID=A0A1A9WJ83_9MUSC
MNLNTRMICRLCLKEVNEFKSAFDATDNKLSMAIIISKHFWFELQKNDPISTAICDNCWLKISDFHEFYKSIEEAQKHLSKNIVVKIEHIVEENSIENVMIQSFPIEFSKQENEIEVNEMNDEVPFDIMTDGINDSTSTHLSAEDCQNIGSTLQSNNNYTTLDVKEIVDYRNEKFNDRNGDPFQKEVFIENERIGINGLTKNKRTVKTSGLSRITRSSSKVERSVPLIQKARCSKTVPVKVHKIKKRKTNELSEIAKAVREKDEEIAKFMSLRCELCKSAANNFDSLNNHMLTEHKINGYVRCCNKKFSKRFLLLDHIRNHSNPERFKCEQCNRIYASRNSMRTHFLSKHKNDEEKVFTCSQCPQKFFKKITKPSVKTQRNVALVQKMHCKNSRAKKVLEVEKNNLKKKEKKELSQQAVAIREQSLAFDEEIAKFMSLNCELCKSAATNFNSLHNHMLSEHKINGYVRCCNKKFSKRFALLDHIRHHSNPEHFKCEQCNRVYANRNSMRTHFLSKHKNDEEKVFTCSQCPQKFFKRYLLRKHELFGHSDHKNACVAVDEEIAKFMPLRCELCNEEATNFTALKGHMRAEHSIKGYVRCCNKKFCEHGLLVEHIRAHLNPACYKCEECSLVFPDRQSMRNHFLMEHGKLEDKPFACSQCSDKFITVYLLQRHKAVAHGDHTKTCSSCRKRFDTTAQLSAHVKEQCLCDTCAEVVCGTAALQRHLLKHKGNLAEIGEECS